MVNRIFKPARIQRDNFVKNRYGDDERWQRARKARLEMDNHMCSSAGCHNVSRLEVHHVTPITKGGKKYALSNLRTLCKSCHDKEHAYSHRFIR